MDLQFAAPACPHSSRPPPLPLLTSTHTQQPPNQPRASSHFHARPSLCDGRNFPQCKGCTCNKSLLQKAKGPICRVPEPPPSPTRQGVPLWAAHPPGFFCTRSSQVLRWFYPPGPWKSFHIRPQCWGHNFPNPLLPQKFPLPSLYHHSGHYTTSLDLPHPCHAVPQ